MGLYVCEKCQCVENTALGQYWSAQSDAYPAPYAGKKLCSECGSPTYVDGTATKFGKWHGKFEKQHIDQYLIDYPNSELHDLHNR